MRGSGRRRAWQIGLAAGAIVGAWGLSIAGRVAHGAVLIGRPRS